MIRRDKTKIAKKHVGMLNGQIVLSCFKMCCDTVNFVAPGNPLTWNPEIQLLGLLSSSHLGVQKITTCKILKIHRSFHFQDPWNRCYFGWLVSCTHPLTNSWFHPSRCLQDISPRVGTDVSLFLNKGVRLRKNPKISPWRNWLKNRYFLRVIPTLEHCSDIVSDILLSGSKYN